MAVDDSAGATGPAAGYFRSLFEASAGFVARAPLGRGAVPMADIELILQPAVVAMEMPFLPPAPDVAAAMMGREGGVAGLNTVGMLLDRLTILTIKQWNMIHRAQDVARAQDLRRTQIDEIVTALALACPGHSAINTKLTRHAVATDAPSFVDAFRALLTINLLLWEAQELLYNHDILALPCEELRSYIMFFSRGNLARNGHMEDADRLFWAEIGGGGAR